MFLRFALTASLLVGLAALSTPDATAQDAYRQQVRSQLDNAGSVLARSGYHLALGYQIGALHPGADGSYVLSLVRGRSYAIAGACDADCSDLDLRLYDGNGNLVASDTDPDDYPIVSITPAWTGRFTLRARMYACSAVPCRYGVAVFDR